MNCKLTKLMPNNPRIILIAPNVSEQMGGEAIKALQIYTEIKSLHPDTIQITHERCEAELTGRLKLLGIEYVRDTAIARVIWKSVVFRPLLDVWFSAKAVALAERIASSIRASDRKVIIHQT